MSAAHSPRAGSRAQKLLGAASQSAFVPPPGAPRRAQGQGELGFLLRHRRGEGETERGTRGRRCNRLTDPTASAREVSGRKGGRGERARAPHCWLCAPLGSDLLSIPPACRSSSSHRTFPRSVPSSPDLPSLCTLSSYPAFGIHSSAPCPSPSHFTGDHSSLCGASPCAMICAFLEQHIKFLGLL